MASITMNPSPGAPAATPAARAASKRTAPAPSSIDLGKIEDLRILDEHGHANADLDPELPATELMKVYRAMVRTRKLDIRMLNMQRQGEMGTFAPGIGQEATQIGQVYPLLEKDWYSPSYRSFGAQLWRGWTVDGLLLLWAGFFEGFTVPEGVNDLPFSIVIGSHVPLATGVGMGIKQRKSDAVAMVNFGDGAISQGVVNESLNFAAVFKAPVVFVCENNGFAISTRTEHQTGTHELARRGPGFGVPAIRVDGNDILAMIVASQRAVDHARSGQGPFFIEAVTYRMGVHTTADDPTVYRDDSEVEAWRSKCPLTRFETYLKEQGVLDDAEIERIAQTYEEELREARERFRAHAKPDPREVFDYMYEKLPPELEAQKNEYLRKLDHKNVE
jgi:pyruvate dehydrogenase E1 component alpha subunit